MKTRKMDLRSIDGSDGRIVSGRALRLSSHSWRRMALQVGGCIVDGARSETRRPLFGDT